ncbi:hypothetical protein C2845_PM11G05360 [Panicum miliaceum]|uniref:Uncharacterized protein n=1 Tax=Panicum miliaceum TaxID=4540 RepID=A0A3L6RNL9_PANMI|nr:hypothetical protein C2845_PM11G05360 [Panicum miliaceum]
MMNKKLGKKVGTILFLWKKKMRNKSYTRRRKLEKKGKEKKSGAPGGAATGQPAAAVGEHAAPTVAPVRELLVPDGPPFALQPAPGAACQRPCEGLPRAPSSAAPPGTVLPPAVLPLSP